MPSVSAAPGAGFEEWSAELHGHEVIYRMAGSGPPVVLIHGMVNSSRHWRQVAEALAGRHTVIAPDLIGHGDSATPRGDYSIGAHAAVIRDLLAAIGIRQRDDHRPLARRRRCDAVLLAVPRSGRAPGADLERRSRPRCQPTPAAGGSARRLAAARARGPAADRRRNRRARERARTSRVREGRLPRRRRPRASPAPGRGLAARVPADAARGDRRRRSAGQRGRPALSARRRPDDDRLGRARPDDPDRARPGRGGRDPAQPLRDACRGRRTSRTSRTPRGWRRCSPTSSPRPSRTRSTPATGRSCSTRARSADGACAPPPEAPGQPCGLSRWRLSRAGPRRARSPADRASRRETASRCAASASSASSRSIAARSSSGSWA